MTFSLTFDEMLRVETAEYLGIHLDPIGSVDLSTIIAISVMYGLEFIAVCYQLYNRNYPPLKVKNVPLMASLLLGAIFWMLGDIFTGGLVHLGKSHILQNCKLTAVWLRATLGVHFVSFIFCLRTFSLYYIFYLEKPFKGRVVYITLGASLGTILLVGIISSIIPVELTTQYDPVLEMCFGNNNYIVATLVVIWIVWAFIAYMVWNMRNVSFCFSEHVEILSSFSILFVIIIMNTICLMVIKTYPAYVGWRNSLVYVNHVGASVGYWIVMWEPTYNCLFYRQDYLAQWTNLVLQFDMEKQYDYGHQNEIDTALLTGSFEVIAKDLSSDNRDVSSSSSLVSASTTINN